MQTCYFEYLKNAWSCPSIIRSTCGRLWLLKWWNQFVGNFDVYLHAENQLHLSSFLRYHKNIANFAIWELCECLIIPIKIMVSICGKLSCLSACKKWTTSLTSFLRYCKEIAKLVFLGNMGKPGHTHLKR